MPGEDKPVIVIEHLEDEFSIWLFLEYRHSSMIIGKENIIYTNIPRKYWGILGKYGRVYRESIVDLIAKNMVSPEKVIVLDPSAPEPLQRKETYNSYIVIGGILGDHPPRRRTYRLLTSRLRNIKARNIGDGQYSIDGAVYYVYHLWRYGSLHYRYIDGVTIETEHGYIKLPFRYPLVNEKPLLAPGLEYYLKYGVLPEDILDELSK